MAKLKGIFKFTGTIGGVTARKVDGEYIVQEKSSLDRERVMTTEEFAHSRLAMDDFRTACYGSKLLREAFYTTGKTAGDRNQYARLTGFFRKLQETDTVNAKGQKQLSACNLDRIREFNWNKKAGMHSIFYAHSTMTADLETGTVTATIPALKPQDMIRAPHGTSHYRLTFNGAAIDFEGRRLSKGLKNTGWLSLKEEQPEQVLEMRLKDTAGRFLFSGIRIEFAQLVNGKFYPMNEETFKGFTMTYLGQVPAVVEEPVAVTTATGEAAVKEALVIIDWEAAKTAQEALLQAPDRKPAQKKGAVKRLMGTGKHQAHRKVLQR